jgi:hypothetical protein
LLEIMMNPVFIVLLCAAMAWLLVLLLRRGEEEEFDRGAGIPSGSEMVVRLPQRFLLNQCLSAQDLELVRLRHSPALLRLFLHERRRLAVRWLRQTRREAHRLVRLHVHSVRYAADLRPVAEVKLFLAVGLFLLVYAATLTVVWWYGPLRTRRSLQSIQALAGILGRLADRIVAAIVPGAFPGMGTAEGAAR